MKGALFQSLQLNMPAMAEILASKGRNGDKILAHITPKEAKKLKKEGGAGTINPETGLMEFYDGFDAGGYMAGADYQAPQVQAAPDFTAVSSPVSAGAEYTGGGYTPTADAGSYAAPSSGYNFGVAPSAGGTTNAAPGIDFSAIGAGGPGVNIGEAPARAGVQLPGVSAPTPDVFAGAGTPTAAPSTDEGITDRLSKALGISKDTLGRLGLGLGQGVMGALQARQAAAQGQQAKKEQQAIAAPYQQKGQELMRAAQAGELSPVNQQALQAAEARMAQGVESRGGVGAAQMATQVEAFRQQLLQQQYDLGLQVSGIGDQIQLGAIKTGMEADRYVNQLTNTYFTNIARTVYGGAPGGETQTITINR